MANSNIPNHVKETAVDLDELGISQREIARRLNIAQSTVSRSIEKWKADVYKAVWEPTKKEIMEHSRIVDDYVENNNTQRKNVSHLRHKTKLPDGSKVSAFIKNPKVEEEERRFWEDLIEEVKNHAPVYPKLKRGINKDNHLLVIDPADIHIGKLASAFETWEEYDQQIAVQRVREWVKWILDKASPYNIDKILFIGGNDIVHTDNTKRTTTSGTPQDTDWMWYNNYINAKKLYVEVLETLLTVADVDFVFNPSNHDYVAWFYLCQVIEAHFRNNNNISFDNDMSHRKYYKYGQNMIWTTHWDWAKQNDLPLLMAQERAVMWSETKHRYIYWHHLHHKNSKDYPWVTFETMRSASWTDSRHHRNWYQHAPKAIEGFLHHPQFGQIARFTNLF